MVNETNIQATPPYAASSALGNYTWEELQEFAAENMSRGYEPYETYPAKWHNSVLHQLTVTLEQIKVYCDNIQAELKNVLTAAGKTPDPQLTNQLAQSIAKLSELPIATASVLGGVKSSADDWNVSVNGTTGVMSVNKKNATTAQKGIVKLNNTLTSTATDEALTAAQGKALKDAVDGKQASGSYKTTQTAKTSPDASGNATAFIDTISQNANGVITATKKTIPDADANTKGITKLINNLTTNDSTSALTAAQGKALKDAVDGKQASGSYKTTQTAVSDPPVSVTTKTAFIDTISQDTNGVITATKSPLPKASTTKKGIVQLNDTLTSSSTSEALTAAQGKALKDAVDGKQASGSYKTTQTAVADPPAGATSKTAFIDSISQDTNGVITVTKSPLPKASTTEKGIVQLQNDLLSLATDKALTARQGWALDSKYSSIYNKWLVTREVGSQTVDYIKVCNQMDAEEHSNWSAHVGMWYNPLLRQLTFDVVGNITDDTSHTQRSMNIWISHLPKIDDTGANPWPLQWVTSGTQVSNVLVSAKAVDMSAASAGPVSTKDAGIYYTWDTYHSSKWAFIPTDFAPIVLLRITLGKELNLARAIGYRLKITLFLSNNPGSEIQPE